jgi:hypothetical protein
MSEPADRQRVGTGSGSGMLMGPGVGIVFARALGPFGLIVCAAIDQDTSLPLTTHRPHGHC